MDDVDLSLMNDPTLPPVVMPACPIERPGGGARVQAPRRAARGVLLRRQDHLRQLRARRHSVGRTRQLRGIERRGLADDEEHRPGSRPLAHPRQRRLPRRRPHSDQQAWSTIEAYTELMKLVPYKRIGEVDDIARAAVWLASDDSDYITGASIYVDGGMTLYPGFETGG